MTDIRLLFPSKYLKAADLRGKDRTLTIDRVVEREELKTAQGNERHLMIYFREITAAFRAGKLGDDKRLVCNITNARTIAEVHDQWDCSKWPGLRITLYGTTCNAFGSVVDCIRVRKKKPNGKQQPASEPPDESEPGELSEDEERALENAGVFG